MKVSEPNSHSKILIPILLFNAVLFVVGINWGLPNTVSWMADSLAPWDPLVGLSQAFSFGYFNKYPMMHQLLLAILYIPMVIYAIVSHTDPAGFQLQQFMFFIRSAEFATVLIYIGRFVSVLMGVGTVYFVYRGVREIFSERAAIFAAVLLSLNPVINYYSHTAKVEVPYIFWAVAALYFLIRAVKYGETRDYIYTAALTCLSFGTKDQGYAIFVLPLILFFMVFPVVYKADNKKTVQSIFTRKFLIFLAVFIIGTVFVENVLLNWEGFIYRLKHLTGEGGTRSIHYSLGIAGVAALWRDVFYVIMRDAMGAPVFIISLIGIAVFFIKERNRKDRFFLGSLYLLAMVSYMLFFVQIIRQSSIRFAFPLSLFLVPYGGLALDYAYSTVRGRAAAGALTLVLVLCGIYSLYNTVSVNVQLLGDARYGAEEWMRKNIPEDASIEYYTYLHYLPRMPERADSYRVKRDFLDVEKRKPDYMVFNNTMMEKYLAVAHASYGSGHIQSIRNKRAIKSGKPEFIAMLLNGDFNYEEVHRSTMKRSFFRRHRGLNISSDYIVVYRRREENAGSRIK